MAIERVNISPNINFTETDQTFTTQNLKTLEATEKAAELKDNNHFMVNDFAVIDIMRFVCTAFEQKQAPITAQNLCGKLNLPPTFGQKILAHLVKTGLLLETTEPIVGLAPATSVENITHAEITDAVTAASFIKDHEQNQKLQEIAAQYKNNLAQYTLKQVISQTADSESDQ